MAFLALTSAQCDADSPLDETLFQVIRADFDDLNSRTSALEAGRAVREAIVTDFAVEALDTDDWDSGLAGTGAINFGLPGVDDSIVKIDAGNSGASIAASTKRMRIGMGRDQAFVLEWRGKESGTTAIGLTLGLLNASTAGPYAATSADQMIGFVKGTNAGTYKFIISNGATNTTVDNLANRANYSIFKMVGTRSTTWSIDVTIDGIAISGSPFTANVPTARQRPFFGDTNTGGNTVENLDYVYAYWTVRPAAV